MTFKAWIAIVVVTVILTVGLYALTKHLRDDRMDECQRAGGNLVVTTSRGHRACVSVEIVVEDM